MDGQISLTNSPEQAGAFIADAQAVAMRRAYRQRLDQNTNLFLERHCDNTPDHIGAFVADIQYSAKRKALIGFMWRWALIGGGCSVVLVAVEAALLPISLVISVPLAIALTMKA